MTISQYIQQIAKLYKTGLSSEHSYRGYLATLLEDLVTDVMVTNEPRRIACGAPDYIVTRHEIPVGYIEAKDVGIDIGHKAHKEQFDRYKRSLDNLIITDYLDFWFYVDGQLTTKLKIAEIDEGNIKSLPANFEHFGHLIKNFCSHQTQTIKSSQKLALMMADKAKLLALAIEKALESTEDIEENDTLQSQLQAFQDVLIHDIKPKEFADIYAQTIAYGMFAARLHDTTLETFTRQEAAQLIPKTNPFLRRLFQYIAANDLDSRIVWIVDALADIFRATDVAALLRNFGKSTQTQDPIIHFYETFLAEYDPALRKARGVWYTPQPIVNFIVRAVDDILKTEFNLPKGLADTGKVKIKQKTVTKATTDLRSKLKEVQTEVEVHKVQILDPATGTGTFLAEVIKHIHKGFVGQKGIWSNYVETHLIPRLNGFEILMASYAMAHLKLDMLLLETGYKATRDQRFRVYLTNSLEEYHADTGTLFANWLSSEANEANHIKRDTPVMVIMGNPPYSGESTNKGAWIMSLMDDYKKEPGGKEKLKERNPKWINDDYVKFLRYGQHFIEKNGEGILAFINPHGYLDNPTFRGMRWNLLKTYNKIYTIDLHGNSKKKEVSPDGSADVNVFDIQQGVSINIFIKTGKKKNNELGQVHSLDLFGKRDFKYNYLNENSLKTIPFKVLDPISPNYFFTDKNFDEQKDYDNGFSIRELFKVNSVGIVTSNDALLINNSQSILLKGIESKLNIAPDSNYIHHINYRPFDLRYLYYDTKLVERAREKVMRHFLTDDNLGLVCCKQFKTGDFYQHVFITNKIFESCLVSNRTSEIGCGFPIYLYPKIDSQYELATEGYRIPNLDVSIVKKISNSANLIFTDEKGQTENTFAPIDILDYIYAVLHSPMYREKYKEFLKIDFPRVPYPTSAIQFWTLVKLGGQLRQLHLLESAEVDNYITTYPEDGDNLVEKTSFDNGKVYINFNQYFGNVPQIAWEFYIGGYQPAQKWLKDRKGRKLSFDDILHYQKMIVALTATVGLMKEIDNVCFQ
jgi:predicted helicase